MSLNDIKAAVYRRLSVGNTRELKSQIPALVEGRDLRTKSAWAQILAELDEVRAEMQSAFAEIRSTAEATDAAFAAARRLAA